MADYSKDLYDYTYECIKNCSAFDDGYDKALKKIKDASVIFDGEKIYGSKTKVILITEEKYNEIFNK